jgi:hypothetical protein
LASPYTFEVHKRFPQVSLWHVAWHIIVTVPVSVQNIFGKLIPNLCITAQVLIDLLVCHFTDSLLPYIHSGCMRVRVLSALLGVPERV